MTILTKSQIAKRRRWAQALESSRQHRGELVARDPGMGECCLGVYCRLEGVRRAVMRNGDYPSDVGVDIERGAGMRKYEERCLAALNDDDGNLRGLGVSGMTHPEIALYLYLTCEAGEVPEK